ncbi:hypothetical protein G647_01554 [Cladophialophora carrionii CBS 160.54]|uniref:Uncharacterized protein n=1 Tax=Cladophialophora carrionii CBS 160.54 TaxID=1279043 RepID=V9DR11_9EURO|nr:uncharacterized protein G647_01554 [Cladophialophora carrionii CBS 160.54]ETI29101.1 hypothetical protein G647_01554 [Cladophialophora carrionii CBS 160.54]
MVGARMREVSLQKYVSTTSVLYSYGTLADDVEDETKPLIRLKHVQFHGSFRVGDDGIWRLSRNQSEPVYVGQPSPEIDRAWDSLIIPRFAGFYSDEAERLGLALSEDDYEHGRVWVEPSGYHDLHCLNYIRQALDREYYTDIVFDRTTPVMPGMAGDRLHLDHCIELLRQSLLCHMDLTPIPKRWLVNGNMLHADQDQMHTCRDVGPIHDWIDGRSISKNPA